MKPWLAPLAFLLAYPAAAEQRGHSAAEQPGQSAAEQPGLPNAARPVLLELFTSQSCSSCPPAEALLSEWKATRPDIVALEFHVDYWNSLNWRDPYSSHAATDRQRHYAAALGTEIFTPQLIIDGRHSEVGSERQSAEASIAAAQAGQQPGPALSVTTAGSQMTIRIGAGTGTGTLLLAGYDPSHETAIPSGENAGATLREVNLVRSLRTIGQWQGQAMSLTAPRLAGERTAILLQGADGTVRATAFP
jgi:hypothetical protein